jgi:hypothetical protein
METISISGFGGFKDAKFETAPIMVLIGEQATGKSIVAKLLYFFRNLAANPLVLTQKSEKEGRDWCEQEFATLFPPQDWGDGRFEIQYGCNGQSVRISHLASTSENPPNTLEIEWSEFYSGAWAKWSRSLSEIKSIFESGDTNLFMIRSLRLQEEVRKDVESNLGEKSGFEQIFVPAARGYFSQVNANIFAMLAAKEGDLRQAFDPFLLRFGRWLEYNKRVFKSLGFFDARATKYGRFPSVRKYVDSILKAEYVWENGRDILVHPDGRRVALANASAAQQESLPLLLAIGRVLAGANDQGRDVYVEEPEAHLFPKSQQDIVELMAAAFNLRKERARFVITTHSPYILSVIDNLLEAGRRHASKGPHEKLERIAPKIFALQPGDVTAYSLGDGNARSIMDRKTKLIKSDIIDKVSVDIDRQFERLLWET